MAAVGDFSSNNLKRCERFLHCGGGCCLWGWPWRSLGCRCGAPVPFLLLRRCQESHGKDGPYQNHQAPKANLRFPFESHGHDFHLFCDVKPAVKSEPNQIKKTTLTVIPDQCSSRRLWSKMALLEDPLLDHGARQAGVLTPSECSWAGSEQLVLVLPFLEDSLLI